MRCDAKQPKCGRCVFSDKDCQYSASRRGGLTRAQLAARRHPFSSPTTSSQISRSSVSDIRTNGTTDTSQPPATATAESAPWLQEDSLPGSGLGESSLSRSGITSHGIAQHGRFPEPLSLSEERDEIAEDTFIDLYYRYFHKSHPCVLPRWRLEHQYKNSVHREALEPLILVIRFIGSLYARSPQSTQLRSQCSRAVSYSPTHSLNPFAVQSHLLFSIALFWCGLRQQSQDSLAAATRLALDLGMHRREFAGQNGKGDAVLEESWRRTWWQVYIADAFFAAMARANTFPTCNIDVTVELPCEEEEYQAGVSFPISLQQFPIIFPSKDHRLTQPTKVIPRPQTLESFDNREFAPSCPSYSSFAYLIGAIRGISSATQTVPSNTSCWSSPQVRTEVDAIIDGWQLHLPAPKRELVSRDGEVDELIFQALMAVHT